MMSGRTLGAMFALLIASLTCAPGCAPVETEDARSEDDALRQLHAGVDVDILIKEHLPVGSRPPAALADVASWSIRHVELRDPANPGNPDPKDPFNGFFLIAENAKGEALFFDAMALTDEGIAHFFFSVSTDDKGNFLELPLVAEADDPVGKQRVDATVAWLGSERVHVGEVLRKSFANDATSSTQSLSPLGLAENLAALKCVVDLAVLGLTLTNPLAFFLVQAGVDGAFAVVSAVANTGGAVDGAASAAVNAATGGVVLGVGKAVKRAVSRGTIRQATVNRLKAGGSGVVGVALVGALGYQVYKNGVRAGLSTAIDAIVPLSCKETYKHLTSVPPNDLTH